MQLARHFRHHRQRAKLQLRVSRAATADERAAARNNDTLNQRAKRLRVVAREPVRLVEDRKSKSGI